MVTPPAAKSDSISDTGDLQRFELQDLDDVKVVLDTVDFNPMVTAISPSLTRGPKPYPRLPVIRAHFAGYLIKPRIDSITALHWALANNPASGLSAASTTRSLTARRSQGSSRRWRATLRSWTTSVRRSSPGRRRSCRT